ALAGRSALGPSARHRQFPERLEHPVPPLLRIEGLARSGGVVAETLEIAVLDVHASLAGGEGGKGNLDLRHQRGVELPVGTDLPGEHEALGWLPLKNLAPLAFRPVAAALVPASADPGLEHHISLRRRADRLRPRPPATDAGGEGGE